MLGFFQPVRSETVVATVLLVRCPVLVDRKQQRIGDVVQLAVGLPGITGAFSRSERYLELFDCPVVIEERVAKDPEPVGHLGDEAVVQRAHAGDAHRRKLGCKRYLPEARSEAGTEARRLEGTARFPGLLEQRHRSQGVLEDLPGVPLVRTDPRPAHQKARSLARLVNQPPRRPRCLSGSWRAPRQRPRFRRGHTARLSPPASLRHPQDLIGALPQRS